MLIMMMSMTLSHWNAPGDSDSELPVPCHLDCSTHPLHNTSLPGYRSKFFIGVVK